MLLVGLLGMQTSRRSDVLVGYLLAVIAVVSIASLGVLLGDLLPAERVGLLGLVPLSMGLFALYQLYWRHDERPRIAKAEAESGQASIWLSTCTLMLGNSGDSIGLLLPLLAESGRSAVLLVETTWLLVAVAWGGLAWLLSGQQALARALDRYGAHLMPWVMILVGVYILMDTATDTLV